MDKIRLEPYDHTCADGCCYTYGYDVYVGENLIGSTVMSTDAQDVVEILNNYLTSKEYELSRYTGGSVS